MLLFIGMGVVIFIQHVGDVIGNVDVCVPVGVIPLNVVNA